MQWIQPKKPKPGSLRTVRYFALFPVVCYDETTNNEHTRWLERVVLEQKFMIDDWLNTSWINVRFLDAT